MVTVTQNYSSDSQNAENKLNEGGYGGGPLTFPGSLTTEWKHIIHFQRYEYSRADAKSVPRGVRGGSKISLPVPQDLQVAYGADWSEESLGLLGNAATKNIDQIVQNAQNSPGGLNVSSLTNSIQNFASDNLGGKVGNALTLLGIDALAGTLPGRVISKSTGLAVNPFKSMLYNAPNLRSFAFSYKCIPSNLKEAETLRLIAKEFKLGMHPAVDTTFEDNVFKYPDVWSINIPNDEYLFKFVNCVLTRASFDFHSEGKAYFNTDGNIPLVLNMSLEFQEMSIITKEDIEKGY